MVGLPAFTFVRVLVASATNAELAELTPEIGEARFSAEDMGLSPSWQVLLGLDRGLQGVKGHDHAESIPQSLEILKPLMRLD
jgi:hypothetical protein